jgi:prepilin-type N-terminal cleavage/methylation domain-containing protein
MKKGFTLLELLIVIGILAILSTTMILVINPAELLKKARDSQRISDLNTLKTAIAYYLTNASTVSMGSATQTFSSYGAGILCSPWTVSTSSATNILAIDGSGWVPIPFNAITGGSPIGALPRDPNQSTATSTVNYLYVYLATSTNNGYEMIANMESTYYSKNGTGDVENTDGGLDSTLYEVGTYFGLTSANATSTTCFGTGS